MLPLLRVLPLGSALASILILMLATPRVRPVLPQMPTPARGALIDAAEHPEWRQFLRQAAYRRADEIERLRDLPQAPTRMPPVPLPPAREKSANLPSAPDLNVDVASAQSILQKDSVILPLPVPPVVVPPPSTESLIVAMMTPSGEGSDTPVSSPRSQQLAGLPLPPSSDDADEATESTVSPTLATLPIQIGETSSTELPVALVPQRLPPVRPRAKPTQNSKKKHAQKILRQQKRTIAPARKPAAQAAQPAAQPDLFQSLFSNTAR